MLDFDLEEWYSIMVKSQHKHDVTIVLHSGITM